MKKILILGSGAGVSMAFPSVAPAVSGHRESQPQQHGVSGRFLSTQSGADRQSLLLSSDPLEQCRSSSARVEGKPGFRRGLWGRGVVAA